VRKQVAETAAALEGDYKQAIQAALNNESLTRQRVETLEALLTRKFLGRLKWLLVGR
jgi:hypothetical protein